MQGGENRHKMEALQLGMFLSCLEQSPAES